MSDHLKAAVLSSTSALHAQSLRLRIVSENLANANVTSREPGGDPYTRKTISFSQVFDTVNGASLVQVGAISKDERPFGVEHNPMHPAADSGGNVKLPNVNPLVELADMREAQRSYEANLQTIKQVREMVADLIDLLKGR